MAKVNISKELVDKIKELRVTNRVKAIDLAANIKKSSSYITKLENGDIKTIDYDELLAIFKFISKNEDDFMKIIVKLSIQGESKDLEDQMWYMNFDTVERKIPVPSSLINYINKKILDLNLSVPEVVEYVNKNEDLADIIEEHNIDISKFKNNLWHSYDYEDDKCVLFIIMKLDQKHILDLLNEKIDLSNYVTIQSILYNLLRLEHGKDSPISIEENEKMKKEVIKALNSYKFYSTTEKSKLLDSAVTQQEFESLLDEFDLNNRKLINELLVYLSLLSDWNIKYTNEKLLLLNKNLKWDASFILRIASLSFHELENTSKSLKSTFLDDIEKLIHDYKNKPESEKTIELY